MDPITVTHLVQDRTDDLRRIADQVRQERALRSTPPEAVTSSPTRRAQPRRSPTPTSTKAGGCAPAEPAV
jgi:hypothetical protein